MIMLAMGILTSISTSQVFRSLNLWICCIQIYINKNLTTHKALLPNQINKYYKGLESAICVTNEANHNLNPSHREIMWWHFKLVNIELQCVQCFILTRNLKVKGNANVVVNFERHKCATCEFVKGHSKTYKINTTKKNTMKEQELE